MSESRPPAIARFATLPANETERLEALRRYNILDTPPEAAFDRITSLAARLFDVPIALISLVDESRAWFKSCYGFNQPEVPREATICSFALLYDDVLVVPDARQDDRFVCNPLVQSESGLRFYAGAPLLTQDGFNLGTLCLLDTTPREALTADQRATLKDLAAIVVDELELRLALTAQRTAEQERQQTEVMRQEAAKDLQLYADVVRNTQFGIVVWHLEDLNNPASFRLVIANPAASETTGFDFEPMLGKTMAESFPKILQTPLIEQYLEVIRTGRSLDLDEVPYGEDGITAGIYSLKVFPLPNHCVGLAFENITARKRVEAQLRESQHYNQQVAEAIPGVLFVHDIIQQQNVYTNRQIADLLGYTSEQVRAMGKNAIATLIHPDDLERVFSYVEAFRSAPDNAILGIEYQACHANGEWRWIYTQGTVFNRTAEGLPRQILGVAIDISDRKRVEDERKQSEEALRQREAELSLITNAVPVLISYVDTDQCYRFNNQRYEEWFGHPTVAIYGKPLWEVLGTDAYEAIRPYVEQVLTGQVVTFDTQALYQGRETRDVSVTYIPRFDSQGGVEGFVALVSDVTERKRTQQDLQQTVQTLQTLVAASPLPIIVIKPDTTVQLWNPAAERVFGWSEAEVLGQPLPIVPAEKQEECRQCRDAIARGETIFSLETYQSQRDGSHLIVSLSAAPLYDEHGTVDSMLFILQDITERQQIEQALKESEEWARLSIQAAQLGRWRLHLDSNLVEINERMRQIWGTPEDTLVLPLSSVIERVHPSDRERVVHAVNVALNPQSSGNYEIEYRIVWDDGTERWVLANGQARFEGEGASRRTIDFLGTALDITNRKQLVASLQQQTEDLAQANRIKDEFLAVLSHELRSPLNPILGWTQLLQTGRFDAQKTKQALDIIERNAKQQTQLIDDLLDISKILRGKLTLSETAVDLIFTIESALETMRLAAEAKSIQIETNFDSSIPPVLGDIGRLKQIVLNLLSNAIKFTPNGGQVEVRLEQVGTEAQIQVKDTGKGITPEFLPYVFESFRQEDGQTTRKFGGLGLGLAIVRQLTELHGGTVRAESLGENAGSTFTIRLPLMKTQSVSVQATNPTHVTAREGNPLQGIRVLVVDDEIDMRELVATILEQAGAIVQMAASATEALAIFEQFQPMVLVSDIGMPDIDGYELMRQVNSRYYSQLGRSIPAIALSAYAREQDQQQALTAGFQLHLAKPIEPETLVKKIVALKGDVGL